jgi:hypothetical protein
VLKSCELANALEKSRSIPLEDIASISMDHKRQIGFVQLRGGAEVQLEVSGLPDLFDKLTEMYSGSYLA